ncbi:MAG TPA: Ig-like domain-containing protein [Gemmatimonadaceae bacterium]
MRISRSHLAFAFGCAAVATAAACSDTVAPNSSPPLGVEGATTTTTTGPVVVSSISVATGKTYVAMSGTMAVGAKVYTDRTYKVMSPLPSIVQGATYIQTANNDKVAKPGSTSFLSFNVDRAVTVYVAHDNRIAAPKWLTSTFTKTTSVITNSDFYGQQHLTLFKRTFAQGKVTLGSNVDRTGNCNMYMVIVVGSGSTTTVAGPTVKITAPTSGASVTNAVTVSASATSTIRVTGVQFQVDGKSIAATDTTSPYSTSWKSTTVANGTHTLTAIATDAQGHSSKSSEQVTVKNTTGSTGGGSPPPTGTHAGWYVTPSGSSGGSGSATSPWDLTTALGGAGGRIHPGDTVWLRAGTYGSGEGRSDYHATLTGTSTAPIVVRAYPGERATINGDIAVDGSYTWYWGFELANTNTSTQDIQGINSHCPGCRFINLIVHDHSGDGFGLWSEGPNQVAYGNIIYNNGFHGSTSTSFGHGIYAQNNTGTKVLQDNILFNQFGYGVHVYGSGNAFLNNFTVDGNVSFNSGVGDGMNYTFGGGSPLNNLVVNGNMAYYNPSKMGNSMRVGYNFGTTNRNGVVTNNYVVGTAFLSQWLSGLTFTGNTVVNPSGVDVLFDQDIPVSSTVDNNTYMDGSSTAFSVLGIGYTLSTFRSAFGWDTHSTMSSSFPANHIVVEPNTYEKGRANIVVYNWSGAGAVTVDLSGALNAGDHFVVVNAQNFFGAPVVSGTYGGPVTIPMSGTSAPASIGGHAMPSTTSQFQTFVVLKQ